MSDIRALLLTDVVDSTKLSEALGDAPMAELWVAHDRAARDLLVSYGGREIDKTDGMLLMFDDAGDAVRYAWAYHRALATLPVPMRARRAARRAGDIAPEQRRGRRPRRQATGGRWPRRADRRARDGARVRESDAGHARGAREPGQPLITTVTSHLKTLRVLLVLDNCEHLVQPSADLAYALLRGAPNVRILASSHEAPKVSGELGYPVHPLPLPARL